MKRPELEDHSLSYEKHEIVPATITVEAVDSSDDSGNYIDGPGNYLDKKDTYLDGSDDTYIERLDSLPSGFGDAELEVDSDEDAFSESVSDADYIESHSSASLSGFWSSGNGAVYQKRTSKQRAEHKTDRQIIRELEEEYARAKSALVKEWKRVDKKNKALDKKRKKALRTNDKLIAIEYTPEEFIGDYPEFVEEKLQDVGFTEISFEPIKDIFANNIEMLDLVEHVVVNSILNFKPKDLFQYDAPIVVSYHTKARLEIPFSPAELKKMTIDEVVTALKEKGFSNITQKMIQLSALQFFKKPGRIDSLTVNGFPLTLEHQTADFDEEIVISYYIKG